MKNIYVDIWKEPTYQDKFKIVRNFEDFIKEINDERVSILSLSFDLRNIRLSKQVIEHLIKFNIYIPFINFHTYNKNMNTMFKRKIKKYFPDTMIVTHFYI